MHGKKERSSLQGLISIVVLLVLLGAVWPATVRGQDPLPQEELLRFRQARSRGMQIFAPYPEAAPQRVETTAPAAVGDWSMLAFSSYRDWDYEIYTAQGDGSNQIRRTFHGGSDTLPQFNRGTTSVVFNSYRDANYEIYAMNADGANKTRLTWTPQSDYMPAYSPDGTRIAFFSYRDGNAEVYVMDADGTDQTRLTWDPAWDGQPTWSPDGSQIAFVSTRSGGDGEIWTMDADGQNQQPATSGLAYPNFPEWSPDGSRFAVNDDFNGDGWFDLAIVNVDGTGLDHPLSSSPNQFDRLAPVWSPDGEDVAYSYIEWVYYQGQWYWVDAYIYGLHLENNSSYTLVGSGYDWYPDWRTSDAVAPSSQVAALPAWSTQPNFTVQWSGSDAGGSGLVSYDVQVRDGPGGVWTDWLPDTTLTEASYAGTEGHTYYFRSRARDRAYNTEPYPPGDGDTWTTVDTLAPSSAASSPAESDAPAFVVTWSGDDGGGSGIASYDVQVRDGSASAWTDWVVEETATQATFHGEAGHTYYFQSRARDRAGNVEAYPGGDGDTVTHTPDYHLAGWVMGVREQPIAFAAITSVPPALNDSWSGPDGSFTLYYDELPTCTLSVARAGFGSLPPMEQVGVTSPPVMTPTFYLPPLDDVVVDGGFEAGDLLAWTLAGDLSPTVTATAHTGAYAALLGGVVPPPQVTPTLPFSASAVLTASGGVLTASWTTAVVPSGALSETTVLTLSGVPTVTGLPTATQDLGLHVDWLATLTDGTPLTATLQPVTLVVRYDDAIWQAAQVAGEETLALWRYDPLGDAWMILSGTVNPVSNEVTVATAHPGRYALLGQPYAGPWHSELVQVVLWDPAVTSGTLSLLYQVAGGVPASETLSLVVEGVSGTVTHTLPLTDSGWLHRWWDVSSDLGPTLTLRLLWSQWSRHPSAVVLAEEVSLGTALPGVRQIYLPLLLRQDGL